MAQFLTTTEVSAQIEQIVKGAVSKLVLIPTYVKLPRLLFERLKEADLRKVRITMIYGKRELDDEQAKLLSELSNLDLHYLKNLHAKCYFNETRMVITSMNMHEFSVQNNREMGVLILKDQDKELFNKAVAEAESILNASTKRTVLGKQNRESSEQRYAEQNYGVCIRCGRKKDFDPTRPLCEDCYDEWAQYENPDYEEEYCHRCGQPGRTSMAKPLCYPCYQAVTR